MNMVTIRRGSHDYRLPSIRRTLPCDKLGNILPIHALLPKMYFYRFDDSDDDVDTDSDGFYSD